MYLYFDRTGVLKEVINDKALRQSDTDDYIYIYVEDLTAISSLTYQYKNESELLPLVPVATPGFTDLMKVPYNPKRDLKYFNYFDSYRFIKIPTSFEYQDEQYSALAVPGNVSLTVRVNGNALGLIVFDVEEITDGNHINPDQYLTLAQFYYLLNYLDEGIDDGVQFFTFNASGKTIADLYNEYIKYGSYQKPVFVYMTSIGSSAGNTQWGLLSMSSDLTTYNFEFERLSSRTRESTDRWNGAEVAATTLLKDIFEVDNEYYTPYLKEQTFSFDDTNTLNELWSAVGSRPLILRLIYAGSESDIAHGYFLAKLDRSSGNVSFEIERLTANVSQSPDRWVGSGITGSTLIKNVLNKSSQYYNPVIDARNYQTIYGTKIFTTVAFINGQYFTTGQGTFELYDEDDQLIVGYYVTNVKTWLINDDLRIKGDLKVEGDLTIASILPETSNTEIGSASHEFKNIYIKNNVYIDEGALFNNQGTLCFDTYEYGTRHLAYDEEVASKITATLNTTDYKLTISLKNSSGTVIDSDVIDFPLEQLILNATYYDTYTYDGVTYSKVVVLTLATTSVPTIIPVGDLISGLVSTSDLYSEVPAKQAMATIVVDSLTNINGRVLSAYESTDGTEGLYSIKTITKGGNNLTEEQARDYMEYMTGSRFLPTYNYEKPQNSLFIMADGSFWKPQYALGVFKLYGVPNPYALKTDIKGLYKHHVHVTNMHVNDNGAMFDHCDIEIITNSSAQLTINNFYTANENDIVPKEVNISLFLGYDDSDTIFLTNQMFITAHIAKVYDYWNDDAFSAHLQILWNAYGTNLNINHYAFDGTETVSDIVTQL